MSLSRCVALWALCLSTAVSAQWESTDAPSADAAIAQMAAESPGTIAVEPLRPEATSAAVADDSPRQLDEIVVTAQKTKQSAQKVPISVSAVDGPFIQAIGATDIADLAPYLPNVRMDVDDLGSPQVFIRGFGTNTFNPAFESSVGFVQDEFYFGRAGYITEAMFDIERVEVLRGPQGTLFGKNTIAGVFNVLSKGPGVGFSGDARASYGSNGEQRYELGVGGSFFDDRVGLRVAALEMRSDGRAYNTKLQRSEEELEQSAQRVRLLFHPFDTVSVELIGVKSDTSIAFWPYQLFRLDDDTRSFLQAYDPQVEDNPYNFQASFDTPGFLDKGSSTGGARVQWQMGEVGPIYDLTSTLIVGASTFYIDQLNDLDVSPADLVRLVNYEDHRQSTAELRFTGSANSLFGLGRGVEFVTGAFFYRSNYVLDAQIRAGKDLGAFVLTKDFFDQLDLGTIGDIYAALGLPPLPILGNVTAPVIGEDWYQFDYEQDVETMALFAQMTWELDEHWSLTPGLRYNRERKRVDSLGTAHCRTKDSLGLPFCIVSSVLQASDYEERNQRRNEEDLSPKLALQYAWDSDLNFYASYARGFKSGGYNAISFDGENLEFEPEEVATYELGLRSRFFDRSLRFNMTLYHNQFENLQVLAFAGSFSTVSNAGRAKSQGLEADFMWLTPWEPLMLAGNVGLLDARYQFYPGAPAPIEQGAGETQNLAGKRIAFAPRVTASFTPTLSLLFGDYVLRTSVDVLYQGDQFTDTDLDRNTYVPAVTTYSARLSFGPQVGWWNVAVGGSNLTDERVLNQVTDALLFQGSYYAHQAAGRQLFAAVTLNW
ncbi:MAG TPA: TonB-dependent receptor [Solimonas sp.]